MTRLAFIAILLLSPFQAKALRLMAYNVQNLFDTVHNKEKNDWEFTPIRTKGKRAGCLQNPPPYRRRCLESDWTPKRLRMKIKQITRMVLQAPPDILVLSEVENRQVAAMLADKIGLKNFVISTGPDTRGIKLVVHYRPSKDLALIGKREHPVKTKRPTRNILEVNFRYKKSKLTIFANHWPSPANPVKSRLSAAQTLGKRVQELLKADAAHHIVALGDFNTVPADHPHPFKTVLFKDKLLRDLHDTFQRSRGIEKRRKNALPLGTYFYPPKMSWNMLDRIFVTSNLLNKRKLEVDLKTFSIHTPPFAVSDYVYTRGRFKGSIIKNVPDIYNHRASLAKNAGYSDHFPVSVKLVVATK